MPLVLTVVALIVLFICLLAVLFTYHTQRSAIVTILHLISNMGQGQYARRADPTIKGAAGELARSANSLAEYLENRSAKAQQDSDHLVSLLAMLDHTNEIAIATDNLDTIRLANAAATRMLERPVEALLGKHIETVIHHPDLRALYRNAFSSNVPISSLVAMQTPGRSHHFQATAATIYNGPHYRGTLLVLRDVTEMARTLQVKTDFATNASHELRTPLASIRAAVETMKEAGPEDVEMTRRCTTIINNHVLRLQLMVQDLLDLSRAEDSRALVRSDTVDLQLLCDALAGMYEMQLTEKKIEIKVELATDALRLKADERLLTLMLKNLMDNSIKFTQQGSITIRSYRQKAQQAAKNAAPLQPGQIAVALTVEQIVLEVSDTGIGIPEEDQERVFERFYTVNRSRGGSDRGTGLGLSIVKHAVSAMQGSVSLSSELQKGTTIRCIFPA